MGIWRRGTGMIVATGLSRKARERFFIFAARRSGVRCDCRVGGRPATASLAFERGAAAVALDVHFEDGGVMNEAAETMAAYGIPEADIARVLGVSKPTLRKHCGTELGTGATR